MCFSASASFIASGALVVIGLASLRIAKKKEWSAALVPLFFAVQQVLEGWQWLVPHPSTISTVLGYGFLFFAFLFWPIYIPSAVYFAETQKRRQRLIGYLLLLGLLVSLTLLIALLTNPLSINVCNNIIYPWFDASLPIILVTVLYTLAVNGSLLASSRLALRRVGLFSLLAELITLIFFTQGFVSIWCFFAALISGYIYFGLSRRTK